VSADKPTRAPFAFFDCPKCKHHSIHAWFVRKNILETYAWCEGCSSYFLQRNAVFFGMLWGGFLAPLLILLVLEGALAPYLGEFGRAARIAIAALVAAPILLYALPYFVRWTIRYEYVGRNAP